MDVCLALKSIPHLDVALGKAQTDMVQKQRRNGAFTLISGVLTCTDSRLLIQAVLALKRGQALTLNTHSDIQAKLRPDLQVCPRLHSSPSGWEGERCHGDDLSLGTLCIHAGLPRRSWERFAPRGPSARLWPADVRVYSRMEQPSRPRAAMEALRVRR